jgi:hypothetical protein
MAQNNRNRYSVEKKIKTNQIMPEPEPDYLTNDSRSSSFRPHKDESVGLMSCHSL